ncbi:MAG: hypothetical protein QOD55_353 [Solirubrobacteraceae bacterium]|nr:hypothetical protein [Solirubrobacteraceae bacterium]
MQLEFPWALGPPDGRYVVRGHAGEPTHVAVLATLAAPQRRLLRRRGRRPAAPEPAPEPVTTARATLVAARAFDDDAAERWLRDVDAEAETADALAVLNRLLHLHRTATADPAVREVVRDQALAVRVGVGAGEQVAEGRWARAVALPRPDPRRARRDTALRPQERLAALLAGRDVALACEELALRARADLQAGRLREAALQLRIALAAALGELAPWAPRGDVEDRLAELRELRPAAEAAAESALQGGLDDPAAADVEHVLSRLEAALRARTASGVD